MIRNRRWRQQLEVLRARLTDDEGSAPVTSTLMFPVYLLYIVVCVQGGLYGFTWVSVQSAATAGLSTARAEGGTLTAGSAETTAKLRHLPPHLLTNRHITTTRSGTRITVTVTGNTLAILPALTPPMAITVVGEVERFTPPSASRPR